MPGSARAAPRVPISFEFFPPRTPEGAAALPGVRARLSALRPAYFSVTYGAGGSTRAGTLSAVLDIRKAGEEAAPHLCCAGSTRGELEATIDLYRENGIRHIVALRGDAPSGGGGGPRGDLKHAAELVSLVRQRTGRDFSIEVACYPEYHPEAVSAEQDLLHFRDKVRAGADAAITQYFYNVDCYFRFMDDCARLGIAVPVIAGIMPIGNFTQLRRFSERCGAEIPRWLRLRMESYGEDAASVRSFGLDVVTALCERLIASGVPGLHFYTLNRADLTLEICGRLGYSGQAQPPAEQR